MKWKKKATALEQEVGMWMKAVKEEQVLKEQEKERREKGGEEKRRAENKNFKKVMREGMMKLDGGGRIERAGRRGKGQEKWKRR